MSKSSKRRRPVRRPAVAVMEFKGGPVDGREQEIRYPFRHWWEGPGRAGLRVPVAGVPGYRDGLYLYVRVGRRGYRFVRRLSA